MKKNLLLSLRVLLGAVFTVSGFQKLTTPYQNFAAVIDKFELLPGPAVTLMAQTLPWAELVLGIFLILGLWERLSLLGLWAMNLVFIAAVSSALARKLPIESCGCFGEAVTLSLRQILAVDVALCVLFLVFFSTSRHCELPGLDRYFGPHAGR